eukprot:5333592-Pyramimonas_sp.AAC.1
MCVHRVVITQDVIAEGFEKSVDEESYFLLNSRLHDFGFRGCTSAEQVRVRACVCVHLCVCAFHPRCHTTTVLALGFDTDTVELTVKPFLSHLVTQEFNSPVNSFLNTDICPCRALSRTTLEPAC